MKENYKMISSGVRTYRLSENANEACENMTTKYETETGIKISK